MAAAVKKPATLILETLDHFFEANLLSQNLKSNINFEKSLLQNIEFDLYKIFNKIIFINKDEYDSTPKESGISYSQRIDSRFLRNHCVGTYSNPRMESVTIEVCRHTPLPRQYRTKIHASHTGT